MEHKECIEQAAALLRSRRWGALATVAADGLPSASMVAYALDEGEGCLYFHLSSLAAHTRALQARVDCSLVVGECDNGSLDDPQQLARLSLQGCCSPIAPDDGTYSRAKECYLQRLPAALPRFDFADFRLFRFDIGSGRFVGGFGRAYSYSAEALQALLQNRD